jgi:hypothetical protein
MNEFSPTLLHLSDRQGDSTPTRHLALDCSYRQVRLVLWSISLAVIALGIFHQFYDRWASPSTYGFRGLINFDSEKSIPTWWSFLLLIAVALIVLLNGRAEPNRKWKPHWFLLGAIFVFLSIDEFSGIHERLVGVLAPYHFTGVLYYSWVIPYGVLCLLGAAFYWRFVLSLPADIRWRAAFAGGLYVAAAVGMEMVGGYCVSIGNRDCFRMEVIAEETGEIVGATLLFLVMLLLLQMRCLSVELRFGHAGAVRPGASLGEEKAGTAG